MKCPGRPEPRARLLCALGARLLAECLCLALALVPAAGLSADEPEPLHVRIDRLVSEHNWGETAPLADDAEFLRRITLDLNGVIPTAEEARAFLDDTSADKRLALIDRLLTNDWYPRRMAAAFDVMLMERRGEMHVKSAEWLEYLRKSFAENKPYNQLAREILAADGVDPAQRPAARFYLDRLGEPDLLTRDVARIFFGRDLQCAHCHNHPQIDDYVQAEYYGLHAFFSRGTLFTDKKTNVTYYAELAEGQVKFESVFDKSQKGLSVPALPGQAELEEPILLPGDDYQVAPGENVRPVPKFSCRALLAEQATDGNNRAFNRNIANRLWGLVLGRALVSPPDLNHSDNPPAIPELLDLLADDIVARKYDVQSFLRELVQSKTYQQSFALPATDAAEFAEKIRQRTTGLEEEYARLEALAKEAEAALEKSSGEIAPVRKQVYDVADEWGKTRDAAAAAHKAAVEAAKALAVSRQELATKTELQQLIGEAAAKSQQVAALDADAEIAKAAALLQQRAQQLAEQVTALTKKVEEQAAADKTAQENSATASSAAAPVAEKFQNAHKQVSAVAPAWQATAEKRRQAHEAVTALGIRLERLKSLDAVVQLERTVVDAQAAVEKARADHAQSLPAIAQANEQLTKVRAELAPVEKAHAEAAARLTEAQQQLDEKQQVVTAVAEAQAKVQFAGQKLVEDQVLREVAEKLKSRSEELSRGLDPFRSAVIDEDAKTRAALDSLNGMKQQVAAAEQALAQATAHAQQLESAVQSAVAAVDAGRQKVRTAQQELGKHLGRHAAARALDPLTPEQMAWSMMQATGLLGVQRKAVEADLNAKTPLSDEEKKDPAKVTARIRQIDEAAVKALEPNVPTFVALYGAGAGQPEVDFFATVDQALYLSNNATVAGWLAPASGNLTERLSAMTEPAQLADELYLSILTRRPTQEEAVAVAEYLKSRADNRAAAIQELAWGLLASAEFRFNH